MSDRDGPPDILAWMTRHARRFVWAHLLAPMPVLYAGAIAGARASAALLFAATGLAAAVAVYRIEKSRHDPIPYGWVAAVFLVPVAGPLWWLRHDQRDHRLETRDKTGRGRRLAVAAGGLVLLLVLAGASAVSASFEWPVAKPAEDFSVTVHVDQDAYEAHDQVHITTEVCSRRWWWRVTSQVPVAWQVVDEHGEVVADTSHRWQTLTYIPEPWAPR